MRLEIRNALGIAHAEIELPPGVVEVVGPNASGKTSLATALQAVTAREPNPAGVPAPEARRIYVRDGAEEGSARLETDGGEIEWLPHRQTVSAPQGDPLSRPEAVGLVAFCARRSARERAAAFQSALLPAPAEVMAQLREALGRYLPEHDLEGALKHVDDRGWEPTEALYRDRARAAKRSWTTITGRSYGVKLAEDWRPAGWLADWDGLTVQDSEAALVTARDEAAALHAVTAVTEAEIEKANEALEKLPAAKKELHDATEKVATGRMELDTALERWHMARVANEKAASEVPKIGAKPKNVLTCPCCDAELVFPAFQRDKLIPFDSAEWEASEAERAKAATATRERADVAAAALKEAFKEQQEWGASVDASKRLENEARHRVKELERLSASAGGEVETEERRRALAEADQAAADAEKVVGAVKARADAERQHETAVRYGAVADALGPSGVRARMLDAGLSRLNAGLGVLATTAEWPEIVAAANGSVTIGGRAAVLCSESEQWRAQAALQLTLGALTGSRVVVLDRADLLDADQRAGLEKAVARVTGKVGMSVVLCATGQPREGPWPQVTTADFNGR